MVDASPDDQGRQNGRPAGPPFSPVNRRVALGALGLGAVGGVAAGSGAAWWLNSRKTPSAVPDKPAAGDTGTDQRGPVVATCRQWRSTRGDFYYIAHRGSGDVYPENSVEAFRAAIDAGAPCLEISVGMTSDGRLICMHDLTYDRTTSATGSIADQPSTILRSVSLNCPQLGPAWREPPLPRVPGLPEILTIVGGRAVLCLEAKVDAAYPSMMALAESLGLADSLMVKAYYTSHRIAEAKAAGYPVFGYLGSTGDVTPPNIAALVAKLDPTTDCLVVPAYDGTRSDGYLSTGSIRRCVDTGVPVWVFPVHRRADAAHFRALGVQGIVTSSYAYVSSESAIATADTWRYKAIAPGEMSKNPASATWAPSWSGTDEVTFERPGAPQWLTLGQFSPLAQAKGTYRIGFDARWNKLPGNPSDSICLAFGHGNDAYFDASHTAGVGYRGVLHADGHLALYADQPGQQPRILGSSVTPACTTGTWAHLDLTVTPTQISWTRADSGAQSSVTVGDTSGRGGYLHIGRDGVGGSLSFRQFAVS